MLDENTLLLLNEVSSKLNMNLDNTGLLYTQEAISEELSQTGIDNIYDVVSFYVQVAVACHVGKLSIDRNASNFEFGFAEVGDILEALKVSTIDTEYDNSVKTQLVISDLRSKSLVDLSDEAVLKALTDDVATVRSAMGIDISGSKASEEVKGSVSGGVDSVGVKVLKENVNLKTKVKNTVNDILAVYDEALTAGYELDKYEAVAVSRKGVGLLEVRNKQLLQPVSTAGILMAQDIMSSLPTVKVSTDTRQINLEEIYSSEHPVYFPLKIAEFALSRAVTSKTTEMNYQHATMIWKQAKGVKDGYSHRNKIEDYLTKTAWRYLEVVTTNQNFWQNEAFNSSNPAPMAVDVANVYQQYLDKFKASMCTFAVLKKHTGDIEEWASAEWVVSAPQGYLNPSKFNVGTDCYNQVFNGEGKILEPIVSTIKGISVAQYTHISNEQIAESEPLFAYKALDSLNSKGEKLSIHRQLLGRSLDGKLIISSRDDNAPVYLGSKLVTAINSGSRSGKGVMTSNAMATSVVDGRPIFGADRKPDTLVAFYEAFGGQDANGTPIGYFVQGGAYSAGNIAASEKIAKELNWDINPAIMGRKDRLVPRWWNINKYTGIWGDMAYYRHMLLTMGILALRSTVRDSDRALYEFMNGDDGIFVLYDEITAWITNFSKAYLTTSGWFSPIELFENKQKLALKSLLLDLKDPNLKDAKRAKLEEALKDYQTDEVQLALYKRDLFENLDQSLKSLKTYSVAGFQQQESTRSDVFIIGQDLQIDPVGDSLPRIKSGDPASFGTGTPTREAWVSFLYQLDTAFIVGYNVTTGATKQAWRSSTGSDSQRYLTESARRFAYFGNVAFTEIRDGNDSLKEKARSVDSYKKSGAVYFKPYLILTNGEPGSEPVRQLESNLGDRVDAIRANNSADGGATWDRRIGLTAYLQSMGASDISTSFVRARQIAERVIQQMGYDGDYLDFLLDLRPEWNFSVQDVVEAFTIKGANQARVNNLWHTQINAMVTGEELTSADGGDVDDVQQFGFTSNTEVPEEGDEDLTEQFGFGNDTQGIEDVPEVVVENGVDEEVDRVYTGESIPEGVKIPQVQPEAVKALSNHLGISEADLSAVIATLLSGAVVNNGLGSQNKASSLADLNASQNFGDGEFREKPQGIILNGLWEVKEFITEDVLEKFGGYLGTPESTGLSDNELWEQSISRIREIKVIGGILIVNGMKYMPNSFEGVQINGLPIDLQGYFEAKQYGHFFSWIPYIVGHLSGLHRLEFDSVDFMLYNVASDLGIDINSPTSVYDVFEYIPSLNELKIGSVSYTRNDFEEHSVAKQSIFTSFKRRQQVFSHADQTGRSFRSNQWGKAKENYNSGRRVRGTMNVLGAGLGAGMQGVSKVASRTNGIVEGARRLTGIIARDIKRELGNGR